MKRPQNLFLDHTLIRTEESGDVVATLNISLGEQVVRSYGSVFVASVELQAVLKNELERRLRNFDAFRQPLSAYGYRPYSGLTTYSGLPAWVRSGVQAIAFSEGQSAERDLNLATEPTVLTPLCVNANVLQDCDANDVAVISSVLGEERVQKYTHLFAASIDILFILDSVSQAELLELRTSYESGKAFRGGVISGADVELFIPERLQDILRAVAVAKGESL